MQWKTFIHLFLLQDYRNETRFRVLLLSLCVLNNVSKTIFYVLKLQFSVHFSSWNRFPWVAEAIFWLENHFLCWIECETNCGFLSIPFLATFFVFLVDVLLLSFYFWSHSQPFLHFSPRPFLCEALRVAFKASQKEERRPSKSVTKCTSTLLMVEIFFWKQK